MQVFGEWFTPEAMGTMVLFAREVSQMNGEAMVLKADVNIFPSKLEGTEISEVTISEITKLRIDENRIIFQETRFARLKKSLRKRSANIL